MIDRFITRRRKYPVALWLSSAVVVTIVRYLGAADPGYDLGIQLQAAYNLLAGRGLSLYQHAQNLTGPSSLITLTYFPSGYSLLAAALMCVGLSLGTTVKLLGAAGTLLGWWGWGRLSRPFIEDGLKRGPVWKWGSVTVSVATPLLFTPPWGGTDIFLWATVPWVVIFLGSASSDTSRNDRSIDGFTGGLCGLALLFRYASLFLAIYAATVILWQSQLRLGSLARRWTVFGAGMLPAVTLQGYINYVLSHSSAEPGGLFSATHRDLMQRLVDGIRLVHHANYLWAFWVPGKIATLLFAAPVGAFPWRGGVAFLGLVLLLLVAKTYLVDAKTTAQDPRILALGLFVAVPLVLLACMTLSSTNYVAERRYYWPIVPLSVLVAYSIASIGATRPLRALNFCRTVCSLYLIGYVGMSLVYLVFLFVPGRIGTSQREKLFAGAVHHWPSTAIGYEYSAARGSVMQLLNEHPERPLLTSTAGAFYWDPAVNGSKLFELQCDRPEASYVDGPARLVILTFDVGEPQQVWSWGYAGPQRSYCFERLPHLKLLRRFPDEGLKLLEAHIDAGERIVLKP